jgi:hypothetical protein
MVLALAVGQRARAQAVDDAVEERNTSSVHARPRGGEADFVLSGRELRERGAQNLADALDLIPGVVIRPGGMGDTRADAPGIRPTSMLVIVDGVPVAEPWMGLVDIASIPTTDIASVRVSFAPGSPLEGPGGDGGVVEVVTTRAVGPRRLRAHAGGATEPSAQAAATGRSSFAGGAIGVRVSGGARFASPTHRAVAADGSAVAFDVPAAQGFAGLRLEHARPSLTVTVDAAYQHRGYASPPTDATGAGVLVVPAEDSVRAVAGVDASVRGFRVAASGYAQALARATDYYADATLARRTSHDDLAGNREGVALHVDRPLGPVVASARASVDTEGATLDRAGSPRAGGRQTFGEIAVGARGRWRFVTVEGALGMASLLAGSAAPWPEGKLVLSLAPSRWFALRLEAARKGRTPTLRELHDPLQGNPALAPEQSTFFEARVISRPLDALHLHVAGSYRIADGTIRLDASRVAFANLDEIRILGLEAAVEVAPAGPLGGGLYYQLGLADSPTLGLDPLFNFPAHRVEARLSSTYQRRMGAMLRLRWVSSRVDQGTTLQPYAVVDLSGWAKVTSRIQATLRITNLLDARYEARSGLSAPRAGVFLALDGEWP